MEVSDFSACRESKFLVLIVVQVNFDERGISCKFKISPSPKLKKSVSYVFSGLVLKAV